MGELYLVRHGQASFGSADYDALSDLGREQAEVVGEHLMAEVKVDQVISGSLSRQKDTAAAYLKRYGQQPPELTIDPGFNEFPAELIMAHYLPYILEKRSDLKELLAKEDHRKHFNKVFFPIIDAWIAGEYPADNIETFVDFKARVHSAVDRLLEKSEKGQKVAVFTSGGTISMIMQKALSLPDKEVFQLNYKIANASVSKFFFRRDDLGLSYFNNFTHLRLAGDGLVTYK